ncbi:hypothetical protein, partial [Mycobacterium tuberculosis]|uniref:hypothetical protein n=1 Tax=Mycobacterium tuberculosis TaxID=1773 RepID=UPI001C00590E
GNTYEVGAIPYGTLLAIPPESAGGPNLSSLGLSPSGLRLAEAFRNYGAYVVDSTDCPNIRADQFIQNVDQLKAHMKKFYPYIRAVTNSAWVTGHTAVGDGTPLAPNCAYDAP